jgi:hypothetical protein
MKCAQVTGFWNITVFCFLLFGWSYSQLLKAFFSRETPIGVFENLCLFEGSIIALVTN